MTIPPASIDTPELRKARGAFFTPEPVTRFITDWAIRDNGDCVVEPSAGDAVFLEAAVQRLRDLGAVHPVVEGVEIHGPSAEFGAARVRSAGGVPRITVGDFFTFKPDGLYDVAIGNPPYIRYQDFTGEARTLAREAALRAGVGLTGLASSWAAFTVHAASMLKPGGRLGLVLPAELLSVNYAAPVREYLFAKFASVDVVLFDHQIFPDAEADTVLLLADGYGQGPTGHARFRQAVDANSLAELDSGETWTPSSPAAKWTGSLLGVAERIPYDLLGAGAFSVLEDWGDTTLGMVTGNNKFFLLSPERVRKLEIPRNELVRVSPPGSSHLRGLVLSRHMLTRLGRAGKATWMFRPNEKRSPAAQEYIDSGEELDVHLAYKCRVRDPWWRVPLVRPADLILTAMNADTPRLTTNEPGARIVNSVHGVHLREDVRELGRDLLPLASLNSVTLLHAEMVGRAYGGGILKIEPKEADLWAVPSAKLVTEYQDDLRAIRDRVARLLQAGRLLDAVQMVDEVMLDMLAANQIDSVRAARENLAGRRAARGKSRN